MMFAEGKKVKRVEGVAVRPDEQATLLDIERHAGLENAKSAQKNRSIATKKQAALDRATTGQTDHSIATKPWRTEDLRRYSKIFVKTRN